MGGILRNSLGEIHIAKEPLATIAGRASVECYGIVGMASKRATDGIIELLGKENLSRGVKVHTRGNEVDIDIYIIVEYGVSIPTVAKNVMDRIRYNVEKFSGMEVKNVNIKVEGVRV